MDIWEGIIGQENVRSSLENIYNSGKIPHAFLFLGEEGIGKFFVGLKFAQLLNSKAVSRSESSSAFQQIANISEPYIKYIYPMPRGKGETSEDGASDKLKDDDLMLIRAELDKKIQNPYYKVELPRANSIKISSIRDIKKFLSINYDDILYRVILITDAHLMNEEAQNALLKSLEEPPDGVVFILCAPDKSSLLETIASRCWVMNFEPLGDGQVEKILTERFKIDANTAVLASVFSYGSVYSALELINNDIENLLEKTISILRYSLGLRYYSALKEFAPVLTDASGKSMLMIAKLIIIWLNDADKLRKAASEICFKKHIETIEKFNERFKSADIKQTADNIEKLINSMRFNVSLNIISLSIIFELASIRYNM
ncbi:MAG TPA: hypothetical protein VHO28_06020, partial [Ignavibacteriales bacterium]|nr:hypothetical protein [Ignavibacteriales bacterium]